jgi:hypothetical protein
VQLNKFNISLNSKQLFNRYAVKINILFVFATIIYRLRRKIHYKIRELFEVVVSPSDTCCKHFNALDPDVVSYQEFALVRQI